ncbi:hypothetical protein [Legionella oakridgensis]|uniref:Uncharacterized protein n=2 Tax=Legionella oakridgensis TaxID=29423 RepID=W0BD11_9GAMM|nr:hypothetical protein [Legionella oakridgensis]AHE68413.1 hypothetical protein Loa_02885 [Legionella oakridgensis ATCC 33761 = DSM 21215]KTD38431.1 hypothetical protein Loak_1376 [Legionella oakridgensis]STY21352.1 Uncharacterised protein [Legionella longbeachae]
MFKIVNLTHRFPSKRNPVAHLTDDLPKEKETGNDPYEYGNLIHILGQEVGCYKAYALGSYIYINVFKKREPRNFAVPLDRRAMLFAMHTEPTGWKLHLSVDPEQVAVAWSLIYPILMAHKVTGIKLLSPSVLARKLEEGEEARAEVSCKQFTIYQFQNKTIGPVDWLNIIQEIEHALRAHDISQGPKPMANNAIAGSQYFSYRNDTHPVSQKYLSDKAAECYAAEHEDEVPGLRAYNLINAPDPFADIALDDESRSEDIMQLR